MARPALGALFRMVMMTGLEPMLYVGVEAADSCSSDVVQTADDWFLWIVIAIGAVLWKMLAVAGFLAWKKVSHDIYHCWNQVADEDNYIATQEGRIYALNARFEDSPMKVALVNLLPDSKS